ncbi:hypothetical protein TWF696_008246 [Orbilia brochopaga]|uniref:DUF7600 domain-containing protein n=1 Tax=Orbilia brochopaga TaxID=3140254 RepID=A0AAV9UJT9_9PEZI
MDPMEEEMVLGRTLCFLCGTPFCYEAKRDDGRWDTYNVYYKDDLSEEDIKWTRMISGLRFERSDTEKRGWRVLQEPFVHGTGWEPYLFMNWEIDARISQEVMDGGLLDLAPALKLDVHVRNTLRFYVSDNVYVFHRECMEVLRRQVQYHRSHFWEDGEPDHQPLDNFSIEESLAEILWNQRGLDELSGILWDHDYGGAFDCLNYDTLNAWENQEFGSNPTSSGALDRLMKHPPLVHLTSDIAYPPMPVACQLSSPPKGTDKFAKIPLEILQAILFDAGLEFRDILAVRQASKHVASRITLNYQHKCLSRFLSRVPWLWEARGTNASVGSLWRKVDAVSSSTDNRIVDWRMLRVMLTQYREHLRYKDERQLLKQSTPVGSDPLAPRITELRSIRNRSRIWNCNQSLAFILAQLQSRGGLCHGQDFKCRPVHRDKHIASVELIPGDHETTGQDRRLVEIPEQRVILEDDAVISFQSYPQILYKEYTSTGYVHSRLSFLPREPIESITIYFTGLPCTLPVKDEALLESFAENWNSEGIATFGTLPPWPCLVKPADEPLALPWVGDDDDEEEEDATPLQTAAAVARLGDDRISRYVSGMVLRPGDVKLGYVPQNSSSAPSADNIHHETFVFQDNEKLIGFIAGTTHKGIRSLRLLTNKRQSGTMGESLPIYSTRQWASQVMWRRAREYTVTLTDPENQTISGFHANFDAQRLVSLGIFTQL